MEKYTGKSILKEIAIGKILFYSKDEQVVQRKSITDTAAELARFEKAKEAVFNEQYSKFIDGSKNQFNDKQWKKIELPSL